MRTLFVVVACLTPFPLLAQSVCATTASSSHQQFVPPAPHQAVPDRGSFWYGSARLWVALRDDGHWAGPFRADRTVYRNKLALNRVGFDWTRESLPPVVVAARRIDGAPQTVTAETAHGVWDDVNSFIMTALDIPVGCWEIDARYAAEPPLTFVVSVP